MTKKTNEKIVLWFVAFSLLAFVAGFIGICFTSTNDSQVLDTFICCSWLICFVPFISLQFFMSAGIYVSFFTKLPTLAKIPLYLVAFPFANLWFASWLDSFWHFSPVCGSFDQRSEDLLIAVLILFLFLSGMGRLVKFVKGETKHGHEC